MREIKFRAWDGRKLQLVSAITFDYKEVMLPDKVERYLYQTRIELVDSSELVVSTEEKSPISCYTGLTDKNGKEIYEGDIILVNGGQTTNMGYPDAPHEPIEHTGVVQFQGGSFYISGLIGDWPLIDDREVIGNRYENPELFSD